MRVQFHRAQALIKLLKICISGDSNKWNSTHICSFNIILEGSATVVLLQQSQTSNFPTEVLGKPEILTQKSCIYFDMHILCTDFIAIPLREGSKARFILWYTTLFVEVGATHSRLSAQQCLQSLLLTQLSVLHLMQRDGFTAWVVQIMWCSLKRRKKNVCKHQTKIDYDTVFPCESG